MEQSDDPCVHCQSREARDAFLASRNSTSHKKIENQLHLHHEELKAVFEASMDCITVWDKDCNCLYANQAAIDYVKRTPDKIISKNITEALSHELDFMQYWKSRIKDVFGTGKFLRLAVNLPLEGRLVHGEAVLSPIVHPDGSLFAVSVVYRDITEHVHAGVQLKASEERFKRLSETTFEAIVIHKNGEILDVNQKFYDMFGYRAEDLYHLDGFELIDPQSHDVVKKNMDSGYSGTYEVMGLKKNGMIFPIEIQTRESQIDGTTARIVAIKDLTLQKQMQGQIVENEKKYRELYDSAIIPLYRTRISDGKLLECNLALASMLGYDSKEECLREHYSTRHYVNPAQRGELLERLKKEKSISKYQIEFIRCNGSHGWTEVTARMNCQEGYIEGGQIDITASKVLGRIEKEVLMHIMQGKCNKEIAQIMHRSIRTIEDHRSNMMKKLGIGNLVELVKIGQFMTYRSEK